MDFYHRHTRPRRREREREIPSVEISRESFGVSPPSPRLITRG